jgi:ParB-like chromosome segregation protein Spo0J
MSKREKEVEISCKGTSSIGIEELSRFQGDLKKLPEKNLIKLKKSILKNGFRIPIFTWKDRIFDGHQRLTALEKLSEEGYKIGQIPIVELEAKNETDAKKVLLLINSRYGIIKQQGFYDIAQDFDLNDLVEELEIPDIKLEMSEDEKANEVPEVNE